MIVKIIDSYLKTDLTEDKILESIEKAIEDQIKTFDEFDFEFFLECLQETDLYEEITNSSDIDLEYSQADIDEIYERITEENEDSVEELIESGFEDIYAEDSDEEDEDGD